MTFNIGLFIGLALGMFIAGPILFAALTLWMILTDIPIEEEHRQ